MCFGLGVLLLVAAALRDSGWLAALALWQTAAGIGLAVRNPQLLPASVGIGLPWLLFAGFPRGTSVRWYEELTGRITEASLLRSVNTGRAVWPDGDSAFRLMSGEGALDLAAVVWSPLGICGLMTVVWFGAIWRKRSFPRHLLLQGVAMLVSVSLSFCCCLLLVRYGVGDGNFVLVWGIQLIAFLAGLAVMFLADHSLTRLTEGIYSRGSRSNPWIGLWNERVAGERFGGGRQKDVGVESEARMPLGRAFVAFVSDLFWSRSPAALMALVPTILLVVTAQYFSQVGNELRNSCIQRVESTLSRGEQVENGEDQEPYYRTLLGLNDGLPATRLRLVEYFWTAGARERCESEIDLLLGAGQAGYAPARVWLVKNSLQPEPLRRLTNSERIEQLRLAVEVDRSNAEAFGMLGEFYFSQGDRFSAERSLRAAAGLNAKWLPELLRVQLGSEIDAEDQKRYEGYRRELTAQLAVSQRDADLRLRLARMELLMGRPETAMQLVTVGRQISDSSELRMMEAEVRSETARRGFRQGLYLHPDAFLPEFSHAMRLAPESLACLENAVQMKVRHGAEFSEEVLQTVLQYWEGPGSAQPGARRQQALARLLTNDFAQVVKLLDLEPQSERSEMHWLALVHSLMEIGEVDRAAEEARNSLKISGVMDSAEESFAVMHLLARAGLSDIARERCGLPKNPEAHGFLMGLIDLLEFDARTGYPGELSRKTDEWRPTDESIERGVKELLGRLDGQPVLEFRFARRLYRLRKVSEGCRRVADAAIRQLQVRSAAQDEILLMLGTTALLEEQWRDGLRWMDAAAATGRVATPERLNNLAVAILRSGVAERYTEAEALSKQAVEMSPGNPELIATRGEALLALGRYPEAIRDFQAVLEVNPEHEEALRMLAEARKKLSGDPVGSRTVPANLSSAP